MKMIKDLGMDYQTEKEAAIAYNQYIDKNNLKKYYKNEI